MCRYYNRWTKYRCNREEYKDGFCIFHCDKENFTEEEKVKFYEEFWKEFERQEKDENLKEFDFGGFKFPDDVSFKKKEFKKSVNFTGAIFNGKVDFSEVTFSDKADFSSATFGNEANFLHATFSNEANFLHATFSGKVDFLGVTFSGKVDFWQTTFNGKADFSDATFSNEADFLSATFSNEADFSDATFSNEADFLFATFSNEADFCWATFQKSAKFIGTEENKVFEGFADFVLSNFETPEDVEFVNVDLSKASFLHCKNIDRIGRVERVEWNEIRGLLGKRKAVYDEVNKQTCKEENYEYIAEIYRKLRLNYERNLRFVEAGDFYIGEMEMRRKNVKSRFELIRWIERNLSPIALYKCFSYYGERYWLPLIWSVGIITIFSLIYSFSLNIPLFLDSFWTSVQVFFQFPPMIVKNLEGFVFVERILGAFFVALFILALRRKFKKTNE